MFEKKLKMNRTCLPIKQIKKNSFYLVSARKPLLFVSLINNKHNFLHLRSGQQSVLCCKDKLSFQIHIRTKPMMPSSDACQRWFTFVITIKISVDFFFKTLTLLSFRTANSLQSKKRHDRIIEKQADYYFISFCKIGKEGY